MARLVAEREGFRKHFASLRVVFLFGLIVGQIGLEEASARHQGKRLLVVLVALP